MKLTLQELDEQLRTDEELIKLRNQCEQVTGKWIPYWFNLGSVEDYKQHLRDKIAEAERKANENKSNK